MNAIGNKSAGRAFMASHAIPQAVPIAMGAAVVAFLDLAACAAWWSTQGLDWLVVASAPAAWLVGTETARAMGTWSLPVGLGMLYALAVAEVSGCRWLTARFMPMRRHPLAWGVPYGVLAFAALDYVILPLSAAPDARASGPWFFALLLIYALLLGPACALFARQAR